jgi:hypothetical protein
MGLFSKLKAARTWQDYTATYVEQFSGVLPDGETVRSAVMGSQAAPNGPTGGRGLDGFVVNAALNAASRARNIKGDAESIAKNIPGTSNLQYFVVTDQRICFIEMSSASKASLSCSIPLDCVVAVSDGGPSAGGTRMMLKFDDESEFGFLVSFPEDVPFIARALGVSAA